MPRKFWTSFHVMVAVYFMGWGFSAADRLLVAMMFPYVLPEFGLNFAMAGVIMAAMSVGYLVCAIIGGVISDRVGRRKVALPMVLIFSLGSALTGFARNFTQLIALRTIVGGAEGAYNMAATAHIASEAPTDKRGFYIGLYTGAFPLFASVVAPLFATSVGAMFGWRTACFFTIIPGLIVLPLVWAFVREPTGTTFSGFKAPTGVSWFTVLKRRNVLLAAFISVFMMTWLWSWLSFGTLYMIRLKGYSAPVAGMHMASMGLGGFLGAMGMSALSDRFGRKRMTHLVAATGLIGTLIALNLPNAAGLLTWVVLFVTAFITWGGAVIFLSVIPSESVPQEWVALGVAVVTCIAEAAGIIVAPPLLGAMADHFGLQAAMTTGALGLGCAFVASFWLRETAPAKLANEATLIGAEIAGKKPESVLLK